MAYNDILLERITKIYPPDVKAVDQIDLTIRDGELMILLGPSGCGKSTTLRMIAGLEAVTAGDLYLGEHRINDVDPKDRNLAIVFQNYALFPHMTVAGNLGFGMRIRGHGRAEIDAKVRDTAAMLGIVELLGRKPRELSGGQRQRVALGRALIRDPVAYLLDEPLSNLDAKLRSSMRTELIKLHRRLGRTIVHVTHDQVEAMTMGERICIMNHGRIVQVGPPMEVYRNPASTFVAGFLASPPMNLLEARIEAERDGQLRVVCGSLALSLPSADTSAYAPWRDRAVIFGIRPEDIHEHQARPSMQPLDVQVVALEALGPEIILVAGLPGAAEISARMAASFAAPIGEAHRLYIDPADIQLFDRATTNVIPRRAQMVSSDAA
jgi:ABC-type sugar transport system ATPase subunit